MAEEANAPLWSGLWEAGSVSEQYGSGRFGFGMREYLFARDQSSFWLPDQPNPQLVNETDMRVLVAAVRLAYDKAPELVSSSPISGMIREAFNRGVDRSLRGSPKDIDDHAPAQALLSLLTDS